MFSALRNSTDTVYSSTVRSKAARSGIARLTSLTLACAAAVVLGGLTACKAVNSEYGSTLDEIESLVKAENASQALERLEALKSEASGEKKLTYSEDIRLHRSYARAYFSLARSQEPAFLAPWVNPSEDREYKDAVKQAVRTYGKVRVSLRKVERLLKDGPDHRRHLQADDEKKLSSEERKSFAEEAALGVCVTYMRTGMLQNNEADLGEARTLSSALMNRVEENSVAADVLKYMRAELYQASAAPRTSLSEDFSFDQERKISNAFEEFHNAQLNRGFDVPIAYRDLLSYVYPYKSSLAIDRIGNEHKRRLIGEKLRQLQDYAERSPMPDRTSPWFDFRERLVTYLDEHQDWQKAHRYAVTSIRAAESFAGANQETLKQMLVRLKKVRPEFQRMNRFDYTVVRQQVQTTYVKRLHQVAESHILNDRFDQAEASLKEAGDLTRRGEILPEELVRLTDQLAQLTDRTEDAALLAELQRQADDKPRAQDAVAIYEGRISDFRTKEARDLAANRLADLNENANAVNQFKSLNRDLQLLAETTPTSEDRLKKAEELYTVSQKLQPEYRDKALRVLAETQVALGDPQGALQRYNEIREPRDLDRANIGLCHFELNDLDKAADSFLAVSAATLARLDKDPKAQSTRLLAAANSTRQTQPARAYEFFEVLSTLDRSPAEAKRGMIDCCALVLAKPEIDLSEQITWTEKKDALEPCPRDLFDLHYQAGLERLGTEDGEDQAQEHFDAAFGALVEYESSQGSIESLSVPLQARARQLYAANARYVPAPGVYTFREKRDGGSTLICDVRPASGSEQQYEVRRTTDTEAPVIESWVHLTQDSQLVINDPSGRPLETILVGLPSPETPLPYEIDRGDQKLQIIETGFEFSSMKGTHRNCIRVRFYRDAGNADRYVEYVLAPQIGPVQSYDHARGQTFVLASIER